LKVDDGEKIAAKENPILTFSEIEKWNTGDIIDSNNEELTLNDLRVSFLQV
jgi:hypothetical protein